MYNSWHSRPTLSNCILWNGTNWLWNDDNSTIDITYSDVQVGWPGEGNIDADPCFVEPGYWDPNGTPEDVNDDFWVDGDYHLLPDSPCINAGTNTPAGGLSETDMDGEARVIWETVDMGADEFNPIRFVDPNRTRKSRTEFAYDCNVSLTNLWPFAIENVQLKMLAVPDNMDINEPNVSFGDTECGPRQSITGLDTCTFTVDRSVAIAASEIVWKLNCERADTGEPVELIVSSLVHPDQQTGINSLKGLAEEWLWQGMAGEIQEDSVKDGTVNLADFAKFADQWQKK